MTHALPIDEPQFAYPPRYGWLKRMALAYVAMIALLTAAWFGWSAYADRAIANEIAAIHAAGDPVLAADFIEPPLAPADNGAVLLVPARRITLTKQQDAFDSRYETANALTPADLAALRSFPITLASNLAMARQARSAAHADWGLHVKSPMIAMLLPWLNDERELANIQSYAMIAAHLDGNDAEAVELTRDILHEGDLGDDRAFCLVEHLVAVGIDTLAADRIASMTANLSIDRAAADTRPAQSASRAQIEGLIGDLLNESVMQRGMQRSINGERACLIDAASDFNATMSAFKLSSSPLVSNPLFTGVLGPALKMDAVRMSKQRTQIKKAVTLANHPAVVAAWPIARKVRDESPLLMGAHVLETSLVANFDKAVQSQFRATARRRAVAILLALRLYELDHDGRLPATLAELTPGYLPVVPVDPFAADGRPFAFVGDCTIDGVRTCAIYSVGLNGTDDHASTKPSAQVGVGQLCASLCRCGAFASSWTPENMQRRR